MAQAVEGLTFAAEAGEARRVSRRMIDLMISWSGAVIAIALIALGAAAIFGGSFALDNVRDRLEPQKIAFGPTSEMRLKKKMLMTTTIRMNVVPQRVWAVPKASTSWGVRGLSAS